MIVDGGVTVISYGKLMDWFPEEGAVDFEHLRERIM
jgi:hypothetical protein